MDDLIELERRLCGAISRVDLKMLDDLLADDYTHIHATGRLDDKAGFTAGIAKKPRQTSRSNRSVRIYGDTAILIGDQINAFSDGRTLNGCSQSVVVLRNGIWRFVAGQLTNHEKK